MLALQQHEAVAVFGQGCRRQHGEGPTVLGGDSVKLTKQKRLDSTCSRSFEEELAKTGSHISLLFACRAQQVVRCLPRTSGSGTKLIYAQLKPSKHCAADQINLSTIVASNIPPCF